MLPDPAMPQIEARQLFPLSIYGRGLQGIRRYESTGN
jgi:hypothetical protein